MQWAVKTVADNVAKVNVEFPSTKSEFYVLLRTDAHHDNPHCNQIMERRHLEQAKQRNAMIIDNGDLFCAMQGKYDKRSSKDSVRPEHQKGEYLDALVDEATKFYAPYAKQFGVLGRGNHETGVYKRNETDLTKRLHKELKRLGSPAMLSGYSGWVKFYFKLFKTECHSKILHHYHGSGGGGPVTRGVIQTNRMAVYTPDADILFSGHTHDEWTVTIARQRLNKQANVVLDEVVHCRAPGYKDAWGSGYGGWEVETAKAPKPIGALWLRFYYEDTQIKFDITKAK